MLPKMPKSASRLVSDTNSAAASTRSPTVVIEYTASSTNVTRTATAAAAGVKYAPEVASLKRLALTKALLVAPPLSR